MYPTIPRRRATAATGPGARGLGHHSLFGAPSAWTPARGKTCPGRPARVRQWERIQLQHFGMLMAANRTGTVFNSADLAGFNFGEWVTNPELRDGLNERLALHLYRLLKGTNSVYNQTVFPADEPQENIKDLAGRLEVLQQTVDLLQEAITDLRGRLGETG